MFFVRSFILFSLIFSFQSQSKELVVRPLLELGLAGGGGMLPDYPGSDQTHFQWAVLPVFYYSGKYFRSDRQDGVYARVVKKPLYGVDMSGAGYFPVKASENDARTGMRTLGFLAELGPRFYRRLWDDGGILWKAFVITRAAVSIAPNWDTQSRGGVVGVGTSYLHTKIWGPEFSYYGRVVSYWASQEYHDYFYSVTSRDANAFRPAYHAKGGYLGTWLNVGASYEFTDFAISAGVGTILAGKSVNQSSPMFRQDVNWSAFVGFAWFFYRSEKTGNL